MAPVKEKEAQYSQATETWTCRSKGLHVISDMGEPRFHATINLLKYSNEGLSTEIEMAKSNYFVPGASS